MSSTPQHAAFYREVGENIRKWRTQRSLSQDTLAKLIGLTRTSLTNIEKGRQHPPLHTFCEIVEKLKIEIADLLPARSTSASEPVDFKQLAGQQVRGESELTFITTAIGIKGEGTIHGHSKK
jgi:transcriptional regulator with XRE-family HTH domain